MLCNLYRAAVDNFTQNTPIFSAHSHHFPHYAHPANSFNQKNQQNQQNQQNFGFSAILRRAWSTNYTPSHFSSQFSFHESPEFTDLSMLDIHSNAHNQTETDNSTQDLQDLQELQESQEWPNHSEAFYRNLSLDVCMYVCS